jgi:hypothetical protein
MHGLHGLHEEMPYGSNKREPERSAHDQSIAVQQMRDLHGKMQILSHNQTIEGGVIYDKLHYQRYEGQRA